MAALEPASGPMIVTRAPRPRTPAASTAMAASQVRASIWAATRPRQRPARPRRSQRGAYRRQGTVKRNPGQRLRHGAGGARRGWPCLLGQGGHLTWPPRWPACGKPGRHDRARRGADEVRALPEIDTALLPGAGQEARQPRFPKRAAYAQDQYVGWLHA